MWLRASRRRRLLQEFVEPGSPDDANLIVGREMQETDPKELERRFRHFFVDSSDRPISDSTPNLRILAMRPSGSSHGVACATKSTKAPRRLRDGVYVHRQGTKIIVLFSLHGAS